MKRAYKYKIKPNERQQELLSQFFGCARFIYNWGLDRRSTAYKADKTNVTYNQLAKELTDLKRTEEYKWLNDCANVCLQQSLRNLDTAFSNFFNGLADYPTFKRKHGRLSCKFIDHVHFDFLSNRVKIPKVGWVRLCPNQVFNISVCKQGTLTVSRDRCGTYWCSITIDDRQPLRPKAKVLEETAVGIDLGIKSLAVLSDGTVYDNPKYYERSQKRLAYYQRQFSKKTKGSKRRERARLKATRWYRRISNQRTDYLHKMTTEIVRRFDTICIEDLNVKGMQQNHNLAKCIQSCSWGSLRHMLVYKCEWHGKNLILIDRFVPSSQTCHSCGYVNKEVKNLSVRTWKCPNCGKVHDRDENASKNILMFGLKEYNRPLARGLKDVEGKGDSLPEKRQRIDLTPPGSDSI